MTMAMTETQSFEELVDAWVQRALALGVATFDELLISLPGVYPSSALYSVRRLAATDSAATKILAGIVIEEGGRKSNEHRPPHYIALPVPHPLDYDWRFSDVAVARLLSECEGLTQPGNVVALLGAPSLLRAAIETSYSRETILLDACQLTIHRFSESGVRGRALMCDLLKDPLPDMVVDAVIADPPWYEEHLRAFMWASAQICRVGGHILISIPPVGTRPGVERERAALFTWAHKLGMNLLQLEPTTLTYRSPAFETNALKAEGFPDLSTEWRRGDLAIFSLNSRTDIPRPSPPQTFEDMWTEECIDGVRVRIRCQQSDGFSDPTLLSIVPGDVLPTVSNRDERRALVDVWTSGNRVFACHGADIFQIILRASRRGEPPEEMVAASLCRELSAAEVTLVSHAHQQITDVIKLEREENLFYGES